METIQLDLLKEFLGVLTEKQIFFNGISFVLFFTMYVFAVIAGVLLIGVFTEEYSYKKGKKILILSIRYFILAILSLCGAFALETSEKELDKFIKEDLKTEKSIAILKKMNNTTRETLFYFIKKKEKTNSEEYMRGRRWVSYPITVDEVYKEIEIVSKTKNFNIETLKKTEPTNEEVLNKIKEQL